MTAEYNEPLLKFPTIFACDHVLGYSNDTVPDLNVLFPEKDNANIKATTTISIIIPGNKY